MSLKQTLSLFLVLLAPIPSLAGSLYPMECGDLRRENRSLSPSPLANPLKVQWITPPCANLGDPVSNPILLSDRVIQAFLKGVRCYDRATGARLWTWACDSRTQIWRSPCYDEGRNLVYVGCFNGDTLALNPQTGNVAWYYSHKSSPNPVQYSCPLFAEGKLFVGNGGFGFLCLDPDTREVLWQFDFSAYFGAPFQDGTCTPAYDNGKIFLPTHGGDLFCLNASDGSVVWHVKQKQFHIDCPLLSDEYVYSLGNISQVECRSRTDGSLVWAADTHTVVGGTNGNLALCGNILIVPGDSWVVWGLNRFTGQKVWSTMLTGNFALNSPLVVCGKVYISACHGDYYSLDGQTGQIEWRLFHGIQYTFVGWAEADGQLYVGLQNGKMLCFTSVTPGDPANCVCNLSATPVAGYVPAPAPTPLTLINPGCPNSHTFTPTVTPSPTETRTPVNTSTPTLTPTPNLSLTPSAPSTITYVNPDTSVAEDLGVPVSIVDEARQLGLDPTTTYVIILLTKHCGCHPHDLMVLRLTMTWDEICALYGTDWNDLVVEATNLTGDLQPEPTAAPSATPTFTFTPSSTPTLTESSTPTPSATFTPTPTVTVTPTITPERVCHPVGYPNPSNGEPIKFNVGGGPYDEIHCDVYTSSFRKICGKDHVCHQLIQENVEWDLKGDDGSPVANGLYFVEITTQERGLVKKYLEKCLVLR